MTTGILSAKPQVEPGFYFDEKTNKSFDYFLLGFIVYTVAFVYSTVDSQNYGIAIPLQLTGISVMFFFASRLIKFKIKNKYLSVLLIAYGGWVIATIAKSYPYSFQSFKDLLFDAEHGVWMYFLPLMLLFPQNIFFYKKLFRVAVILAVFFLIYDLLFIKSVLDVSYDLGVSDAQYIYEHFVKSLSVTIGFLILTYKYQSSKVRWFSLVVVGVSIFFDILRARRGMLFLSVCPVIIGSIIYAIVEKRILLVLMVYGICAAAFFSANFKRNNIDNGLLALFVQRVDENTRSPVEECFYRDMKPADWIMGRGISGQYYCPDIDLNDKTGYRDVIETDYLNIILKGGLVNLALLLLIMLPAVIRGLFMSKNLFSKAAAIWILLWIMDLYPTSVHTFSFNYLLVWVSVGICYNAAILKMPEKIMRAYFFSVNDIARKLPVG